MPVRAPLVPPTLPLPSYRIGDKSLSSSPIVAVGLGALHRSGSKTHTYLPDLIVLVDDGYGDDDLLHLIIEIKCYRREDAKEKKTTMETYWMSGVNNLDQYGHWAFAEFTEVYQTQLNVEKKVETEFEKMLIKREVASKSVET